MYLLDFLAHSGWQIALMIGYIYVLFVLFRTRKETLLTSYFLIFKFVGICDVLMQAGLIYISFQRIFGIGYYVQFLMNFGVGWTGAHYFIHMFGTLAMDFNQFTTLKMASSHAKIWTKRNCYLLFIVIFTVSYLSNSVALLSGFKWEHRNGSEYLYDYVGGVNDISELRFATASVVIVYTGISICLSVYIVSAIRRINYDSYRKNMCDTSLVFISLANAIFSTLEFLHEISHVFHLNKTTIFGWITKTFDIYFFLLISMNSFAIILLSPTLRSEIKERWTGIPHQTLTCVTTVENTAIDMENTKRV